MNQDPFIAAGERLFDRFAAENPELFLGSDAEENFPSLASSLHQASLEALAEPERQTPEALARRAWELFTGEIAEAGDTQDGP